MVEEEGEAGQEAGEGRARRVVLIDFGHARPWTSQEETQEEEEALQALLSVPNPTARTLPPRWVRAFEVDWKCARVVPGRGRHGLDAGVLLGAW